MKLKLLNKDKQNLKCRFELSGIEYWFINTIRRMIVEEVPVLAIEDVEFIKNQSALYDEIIAHRLGLLPLKTDFKTLNLREECSCSGKGCALCQVTYTLKEKGPKTVYASSLKVVGSNAIPVYPKMPIIKLEKGQELELKAVAIMGKGKVHVKWSPGLVYYQYYPIIKIDNSKCKPEEAKKYVDACPRSVLTLKNNKLVVDEKKLLNCHLCGACVDACSNGCVSILHDETHHLFTVESWGQLSCTEIVLKAAEIFENKLNELATLIKS